MNKEDVAVVVVSGGWRWFVGSILYVKSRVRLVKLERGPVVTKEAIMAVTATVRLRTDR